jgi:CheY-like chemotaxis protein
MNVMIIDDIKSNRILLERIIHRKFACDITSAEGGKEALDMLPSHPPDVIMLDWFMPLMNGSEFLQILRSKSEWEKIPVVLISAMDENAAVKNTASIDIAGYLPKPFSAHDVERILTTVLGPVQ